MTVVYNIEPLATRQDVIIIYSVSSASIFSVYPVQVANLDEKDIWIKANSRLGTVSECVIDLEPQQDSQYTFLETPPKEKRIVLKEDVEETEDSSDFDENHLFLIPWIVQRNNIGKSWTYSRNIQVFSSRMTLGYSTIVRHQIHTTDGVPVTFPYCRTPPNQFQEVKKYASFATQRCYS